MSLERHFFPGGNSGQGFYGRFDQIMPYNKAKRLYLLKGGPGVGKSNFMRRAAERVKELGFGAEYFHCSSDPDSLDAVAFEEIGVAMFDATAPHTLDPVIPGAVDNIINLGECLDIRAMAKYREEITRLLAEIRFCFDRTYRYLAASAELKRDTAHTISRAIDNEVLIRQTDLLFNSVFLGGKPGYSATPAPGVERRLFLDAITPSGVLSYLPKLEKSRIIALDAPWGFKTDTLLAPLRDEALRLGFFVEGYYDPLEPLNLAHLAIPELSVIVMTGIPEAEDVEQVVSLVSMLNAETLASEGIALRWNHHTYENLEAKAIESLRKEKALHDDLESYYTTNMDFCKWQNIFDRTMEEISELCDI